MKLKKIEIKTIINQGSNVDKGPKIHRELTKTQEFNGPNAHN